MSQHVHYGQSGEFNCLIVDSSMGFFSGMFVAILVILTKTDFSDKLFVVLQKYDFINFSFTWTK